MNSNQEKLILDIICQLSVLRNIDIELSSLSDVPDEVKSLLFGVSLTSKEIQKKAKMLLELNDNL